MKLLCAACLIVLCAAVTSAASPLEGKWLGTVDTDKGTMQIGLDVHPADGKLTGRVQTAHGDWPIVSVVEEKGVFTVTFDNGEGRGTLKGEVKDARFTGTWDNSPMATGTFELHRRSGTP